MSRKIKYFKSTEELIPSDTLKTWQEERDESVKSRIIDIKPRTENQRKVITSILTNVITFIDGCAGTGKSYLCSAIGSKLFIEGKVDKIVLTRPQVEVGNHTQGFLPGTALEKMMPFMEPIVGYFKDFLGDKEVDRLIKEEIIQIRPLGLLRSHSFKNAYIYCDESQGLRYIEGKTLLTRIDIGSRLVLAGDNQQRDLIGCSDFDNIWNRLYDLKDEIGFIKLGIEDVQRAGIVKKILARL